MSQPPKSEKDGHAFWSTISRVVQADPREHRKLIGASGVEHSVQSIAIDEERKRLIVVAAEADPRSAAMMQLDLSVANPGLQIILVRPTLFDIPTIARRVATVFNVANLRVAEVVQQIETAKKQGGTAAAQAKLNDIFLPLLDVTKSVPLPATAQVVSFIQQVASLDWEKMWKDAGEDFEAFTFPLIDILNQDSTLVDLRHGICPIPMYDFSGDEIETIVRGANLDDVEEILRKRDIYQYFFPARDNAILSVIDRGEIEKGSLLSAIDALPTIGHPFGREEIITAPVRDTVDLVQSLQDAGFAVEGESSYALTPKGETLRSKIKFRPREALISKIINRFKIRFGVRIDTKDFT